MISTCSAHVEVEVSVGILPVARSPVGLADKRDERPQLQEPLLGLLVADVGGDAGRELRELLAEPCDVVGVQHPQGDAQPVVRGPERQGGEDVVDRVEAGADLIERGTERACQRDEVLPAPLRQAAAPFLAAFGEAGSDDLVEDVAVLGVGVDADAAVRVGPAGLELLEDADQGGGRSGRLSPGRVDVRSASRARSFGRLRSKSARLSRLPTSTKTVSR